MVKHAQGPWELVREQYSDDYAEALHRISGHQLHTRISGKGGVICTVHPCANPRRALNGGPDTSDMPEPEGGPIQTANARLIAKSPELYEACNSLAALAYSLMAPARLPQCYHDAMRIIAEVEGN